ncbi:hypothetical protein BV378_11465 [Nostoc sp. RF31YmG]|jgi:hypothetical protein|nr:hypothetical protein BV378_11465 [Nostoc sp. RF31YmG]
MTEEVKVILKTHDFLKSHGLYQQNITRIYTDAHHTLLSHKVLEPFQRFTLDMGDFVLHPDLVGQLSDGETIFAVEAKGDDDLLKGLAQAEMYQAGFHHSFLAADATAWGTSLIDFARRKNVGVITVSDTVKIIYSPEARMPLRESFKFIYRQMESVIQFSKGETFYFNVPTHYLVWSIVLKPDVPYSLDNLPNLLIGYPMPKDWNQALAGAQKLGMVRILGKSVQLTPVGAAVKVLLPTEIAAWTEVHEQVKARAKSGITLADCQPQAAAALRILILQNSMTRLVIEGLQKFDNYSANFADLAKACDQIDHARAPVFFLEPRAAALLTDDKGQTHWERAKGEDYRSTMFQQYKSILIHAGILNNTKLGGTTAKGYKPEQDIWALI